MLRRNIAATSLNFLYKNLYTVNVMIKQKCFFLHFSSGLIYDAEFIGFSKISQNHRF